MPVEMSKELASEKDISDGEEVVIETARGSIKAKAHLIHHL